MSNDITALMAAMKAAAEKATPGEWSVQFGDEVYATDGVENEQIAIATNDARDADFIALANPANVRALVEALEKAQAQSSKWLEAYHKAVSVGARYEERIADLESRTVKLPHRNLGHPKLFLLCPFPYYDADDMEKALAAAGIKVEDE